MADGGTSMFSLQGKRVLIIGGSYGIGLATAEMAVDAGAKVALAARGPEKLQTAAASLEERGGRTVPWTALRIEDRPAVTDFLGSHAPFDHLVLPGSTVKPVLYEDLTEEEAHAAVDSKFWGPFWAAYDARPHFRSGGSVVFFTGVAAERPVKGYIMGACINGALNAGTRSLALEFAKIGVRVNTIAPGLCDTPLNDILHGHDKEERYQTFSARLPVGRVGHAEDCAMGAIYLMCNGFVTGEVLGIDGGQKIWA
jgi:NAD(P)-dependent dehydrogenase (short-subunit alcohol dehydrogenase family)